MILNLSLTVRHYNNNDDDDDDDDVRHWRNVFIRQKDTTRCPAPVVAVDACSGRAKLWKMNVSGWLNLSATLFREVIARSAKGLSRADSSTATFTKKNTYGLKGLCNSHSKCYHRGRGLTRG